MTIFLSVDGVSGESTDDRHKGEIELLSWALGVSNVGSAHTGGGGGAGKASFTDLSITKVTDLATPRLMQATASGKRFLRATLTVRSPGAEEHEPLRIALFDVQVTSCSTGSGDGDVEPRDAVTLSFGRIQMGYTAQLPNGEDGPVATFGWDLGQNRPI